MWASLSASRLRRPSPPLPRGCTTKWMSCSTADDRGLPIMSKKSRQRKFEIRRSAEAAAAKTVPIPPATHKPWQIAVVCVVLAVVTVFAFRGVRSGDFLTCDDDYYVLENRHVQQ